MHSKRLPALFPSIHNPTVGPHLVMLAALSFVKMPFFSQGTDNHLVAPSASGESICMFSNQQHAAVRLNSALH